MCTGDELLNEVRELRAEVAELRSRHVENQVELLVRNLNEGDPSLLAAIRRRRRIEGGGMGAYLWS